MPTSQYDIHISDDAIYFGGRIIGYIAQRAPYSEKDRFKRYVENLQPVDECGEPVKESMI
jgi:hypothetical protein